MTGNPLEITGWLMENSEVFPSGSVAVAEMNCPVKSLVSNTTEKPAVPKTLVLTLAAPSFISNQARGLCFCDRVMDVSTAQSHLPDQNQQIQSPKPVHSPMLMDNK